MIPSNNNKKKFNFLPRQRHIYEGNIRKKQEQVIKKQTLQGKQPSTLFQFIEHKLNDKSVHYLYPFSQKSLVHKHYYNMEKKLQNMNQILELVGQLCDSQQNQIKDELKRVLQYQQQLLKKYQGYQAKLTKLIGLQNKLEQLISKKNNQYQMDKGSVLTSPNMSKKSNLIKQNMNPQLNVDIYCVPQQPNNQIEFKDTTNQLNVNQINQMPTNLNTQQQNQKIISQLKTKISFSSAQKERLKNKFQKTRQLIKTTKQKKQKYLNLIRQMETKKVSLIKQQQRLQSVLSSQKNNNIKLSNELNINKSLHQAINQQIQPLYIYKKQLNNQLQELRGNIRVYCRIRPIKQTQIQMNYQIKQQDVLFIKKCAQQHKSTNMKTDYQFVFDRIFDQNVQQQAVFQQISQLLQTSIDGFNLCIFAYGQTGSGKTFTMQGIPLNKGIIPRSTQLIFSQLNKYKQNGWQTQLAVSINEIYNDQVVNLLLKSQLKVIKPSFVSVKSISQVNQLFTKAINNRSTAFTLSNADSSRSHLIFIIRIRAQYLSENKEHRKSKEGHLVLIDLAGSQRVKESGVTNQRLKQAQHINLSLSQLGQVIKSLKNNKEKTNFRNSKLTYFLEPYLQKRGKAIMFVNISPSVSDQSQSINSLKFASTARECRMNEE